MRSNTGDRTRAIEEPLSVRISIRGKNEMECSHETHDNRSAWPTIARDASMVRHIGITLFNGFALHEAVTIGQAFQSANTLSESGRHGAALYNISLLSVAGGMIASSSSVLVWTESVDAHAVAENFHALFIIGGNGIRGALRDERLIRWLQRAVPRSQLTYSITEGRLLFEAAVTRPHAADDVLHAPARRPPGPFPGPRHANASDPLQTALSVIQGDLGTEVAKQIAAGAAPPRETQFTPIVRRNTALNVSERIQASARWLAANGERAVSICEAAQVAAMSERNFLRRFKLELGITPSDYLMYVRLDMCCRLLTETDLPIRTIALRCGFNGGGRMSKLFRQHLSTTPTAYRLNNRLNNRAAGNRARLEHVIDAD
ncbi:Helix-turn-helix, AraC domain-containing protein [Burkholderia multivorans]